MYLSVNNVKPLSDYMLELTFENSEIKVFDVKPYLDIGVFTALKDENFFKRVNVSYDTIEWPDGIDLDPEVLYEKSVERNMLVDIETYRNTENAFALMNIIKLAEKDIGDGKVRDADDVFQDIRSALNTTHAKE